MNMDLIAAHEDKNVQKVFADVLAFLNSCK